LINVLINYIGDGIEDLIDSPLIMKVSFNIEDQPKTH